MAYNPLAIVVDYARQGYYDEAQQEATGFRQRFIRAMMTVATVILE